MYKPSKPYKQKIIDAIKRTWRTPYMSVQFNTYPVVSKKFSFPEVDHTDGIGTKGFYHWARGTFKEAVIDALAMNLNDLAIVRAIPYKLSNHITVPVEDGRVLKIIQELVSECLKYKIAVVGGENSFHDNTDGLDISVTVSGFIRHPVENKFRVGDVLVGFKSSGLHSNGFTAVRKLFGRSMRREFTTPTAIYINLILKLLAFHRVHGMMHITGGAFTKLKDILDEADAIIKCPASLSPHPIFYEIYKRGFSSEDMYTTFNCGIGFVLSVPSREASRIVSKVKSAAIIGKVVRGKGQVRICSAFDDKQVIL